MKAIYFVIIFTLISCKEKGYIDYSDIIEKENVYYYKNDGGLVDGKVNMFYKNGQFMLEFKLKDGKLQDTLIRRYSTGKWSSLEYYKDGKRQGYCKRWHSNGALSSVAFYVDDKINGTKETWHQNHQLNTSEEYKDGVLHGESKEWLEDGTLNYKIIYKNGKKHGLEVNRNTPSGRISRENYINGKKVGVHEEWGPKGKFEKKTYKYDLGEYIPEGKIEDDLFSYLMGNSWTCNGHNVTFNRTRDDSGDVIFKTRLKTVNGVFIIKPEDPSKINIYIREWDYQSSSGENRYKGEMSCWLDKEGNIKGNSILYEPTYHPEFGELLAPTEVLIERDNN